MPGVLDGEKEREKDKNKPHRGMRGDTVYGLFMPCTKKCTKALFFSIISLTFVPLNLKWQNMITVSAREFRGNQASIFAKADSGEKIIIRRGKKQAYTLVPVYDEDLDITPALQAKIDKARQEYREGKTTTIRSHEELDAFFESL